MEEEMKGLLPPGAIRRIIKPSLDEKEAGLTSEIIPALNKAMCKVMKDVVVHAAELTKSQNKTRITHENLKTAGEKFGILIE